MILEDIVSSGYQIHALGSDICFDILECDNESQPTTVSSIY